MRPVGNALETQRLRVNSKKFTFGSPGTRGGRFLQRIRGPAKRLGKLGHFWVTATKIFMAPSPPDSLKHEARRGLALLKSGRTLQIIYYYYKRRSRVLRLGLSEIRACERRAGVRRAGLRLGGVGLSSGKSINR